MFTGIIETTGKIIKIEQEQSNIHVWLTCSFVHELKIDQSVAHDGVCLTVVELKDNSYRVTAIQETLDKTNLKNWKAGDFVNIERCMPANGRFDGHIVQGHVDETAKCIEVIDQHGSWKFTFELNSNKSNLIVEKGSICINGTSLTVAEIDEQHFSVCIIPYTYEHTSFKYIKVNTIINLEYDIIGKYVAKMLQKN
jgi:riboflavin synthase